MAGNNLFVTLFLLVISITNSTSAQFKCAGTASCYSLIDYTTPNATTLSAIKTLFSVKNLVSLLGANNLPPSTSPNQAVLANQTIKIPISCVCGYDHGNGISDRTLYTVKAGDSLDHIARDVFSGLITYSELITMANVIPMEVGHVLRIPLPCSCVEVGGEKVVHYGHIVEIGSTLELIAEEYGTSKNMLMILNGGVDDNSLYAGQLLDVPLRACNSSIDTNSVDYPLLVPNATYIFTANNCIRCKCDSANNWMLQCEQSGMTPSNSTSSTCPSGQCGDNLSLGNATTDGCNITTCAYSGFNNRTIFTTLATLPACSASDSVDRTWIWIITAIVTVLIAAFMSTWLYLRWRRLKLEEKFLKELMTDDRATDIDELQNNGNRGYNLQIYNAVTISAATNRFSPGNKLGEGGFGPVYKGRLSEGQEIAVKRLSSESGQGLVEYKNELILIAKLQHINLVRLLGFCIQGEDKMLVYEYMPNKSLDFFIFGDESRREMLDWSKRFNIIDGIAQGLVYLHKYSRLRIVHRDLKASNILLDKDMVPKISDFGLARYFRQNESEANTCTLVGTRGYISPEYIMEGIFSVKSDVYSFGVLLLEIISGKRNNNVYHHDRPLNLVGYAWELWKDNSILEILEPSLKNSASEDQVRRCINIGLLCVEQSPLDRPIMSDVLFMLTSEVQQLPMPKRPAFYIGEDVGAINQNERDMKIQTINCMSISEMDGR